MKKLMIYIISLLSVIALLALGGCGSSGTSGSSSGAQSAAVQQQATTVATTTTAGSTTTALPLVFGTASGFTILAQGTAVIVEDVNGNEATGVVGDMMGTYSVNVSGLTAPFIIQAGTYYSFAAQPGEVTDVNPLTSAALFAATGINPAAIFSNTAKISANLATLQSQIGTAVSNIQANLAPLYPGGMNIQTNFYNGVVTNWDASYNKLLVYIRVILNPATSTTGAYIAMLQMGQTTPFLTITYANGTPTYTPNSTQVAALASGVAGIFVSNTIVNMNVNLALPTAAPASSTDTWSNTYSELIPGLQLLATLDDSGTDGWNSSAHPLVFITTQGLNSGASATNPIAQYAPGFAIWDAYTKEALVSTQYTYTAPAGSVATYSEDHGLGASPDGKYIYLLGNYSTSTQTSHATLNIVNARTLLVHQILNADPHHLKIMYNANTQKYLILVDTFTGYIFALDPSNNNTVAGAVSPANFNAVANYAFGDPSGQWVFVTMKTGFDTLGGVAVVSTATWTVSARIPTDDESPYWVTFTADDTTAYVSGPTSSTEARINMTGSSTGLWTLNGLADAGVEGPYGNNLNWTQTFLFSIGKGGTGDNLGHSIGIVSTKTGFQPPEAFTGNGTDLATLDTGPVIELDHGIINPDPNLNELWVTGNTGFYNGVINMGDGVHASTVVVKNYLPQPNLGTSHSGCFVRYGPNWAGTTESDENGLHADAFTLLQGVLTGAVTVGISTTSTSTSTALSTTAATTSAAATTVASTVATTTVATTTVATTTVATTIATTTSAATTVASTVATTTATTTAATTVATTTATTAATTVATTTATTTASTTASSTPSAAILDGQTVFLSVCDACHSVSSRLGSSLLDIEGGEAEDSGMAAAVSPLTATQLNDVVAFLNSALGQADGAKGDRQIRARAAR